VNKDDFAIDHKGRPLPFSADEVNRIVQQAMDDGDLLLVILRYKGGPLRQVACLTLSVRETHDRLVELVEELHRVDPGA
jgi:hypothetical protein